MEFQKKSVKGQWETNYDNGMDFFIINDAIFSKLCILGDDIEPCFEGSSITAPNVSASFTKVDDNFRQTLFTMMQDLKFALEGGQKMIMDEAETKVTEPTCTAGGYTTYTCECGDTYTGDETKALGHDMGGFTTVTEATCTTNGVKTFTCTGCGKSYTEVIPSTGHKLADEYSKDETGHWYACANCDHKDVKPHNFDEGVVTTTPTETVEGIKTYTCQDCGYEKTEKIRLFSCIFLCFSRFFILFSHL